MRRVRNKDDFWPGEKEDAHVKEEDFTKEEELQGFNATPMDLPDTYPQEQPAVRQRNQGKEETYSRRKD